MAGMLDGVRVVEYTSLGDDRIGMVLVELGAEVVKLEPKEGSPTRRWWGEVAEGWSPYHLALNRGKKSVALDLGGDEGRRLAARLVASAGVFVRSYDPNDAAGATLSYATLRAANARLVHCDISPFGVKGQYERLAGTLNLAVAASGRWSVARGEGDVPAVSEGLGGGSADAGALYAAYGIISALWKRARTGEGCYLDVSQMDAQLCVQGSSISRLVEDERVHQQAQGTTTTMSAAAKYNYYETKDGKFMLLALIERQFWNRFAEVAGRPDLVDTADWDSPVDFASGDVALRRTMAEIMLQKTLAEWVAIFREHRIAGGPATPPEELADDPHLRERGIIVETVHPRAGRLRMPGSPLGPLEAMAPAPALGEHTAAILAALGESEDAITRLRAQGVIA